MDVTAIFAMCYSASLCLMVVCMLMGFLLGYNVRLLSDYFFSIRTDQSK